MARFGLIVLSLMTVALLAGCPADLTGVWSLRARLEQPFTLQVGQTAYLGSLRVTFLRVLADSRCPADVVCVWAGNAKVEIAVALPGKGKTTATINSTLEPKEVEYDSFRVRYVNLEPSPLSTRPIKPRSYRLTLQVSAVR